jgi:hypothetical protein
MKLFRGIAVCLCLACFLAAGLSAQIVAPVSDQTKELKRTAHQLRINVEHLKNARAALREATDLARHSLDSFAFSQISSDWVRIDKGRASGALEDLYGWLRTTARDAPDAQTYQRCMSGAQMMLREIATLDSEKAVSLWRMWPDPPGALGENVTSLREQAGQFERQLAAAASGRGVGAGPDGVIDSTAANQQAARGNYSVASLLAMQLNQSGNRAEALKVVDQTMATFRQGAQDPRAISSYLSFVRQLPNVDPDRYLQALGALVPSLSNQAGSNTGGSITVGSQTLQLTAADAAAIELCRNLNGHPDLAMKTLDTVPGLKSKLNGIGGIDNVVGPWGPMNPAKSPVSMSYSIDGVSKTTFSNTANGTISSTTPINAPTTNLAASRESGTLLYQSLRGKLAKDPTFVKQQLADAARTPDQIDVLINLANYATSGDPDLASLALEYASQMVMQVEPLSKRSSVMQQLIQAYQRCDGEVDAALLQEGLVVVQQLRDEQNSAAAPMPPARGPMPGRGTMADQLEMAIVAELALDNFDGAMKYLRLMTDDLRLQALLRIVQTLMQPF